LVLYGNRARRERQEGVEVPEEIIVPLPPYGEDAAAKAKG
jgi:hypothetical protein